MLTVDDLPNPGWRVIDERAWRTGASGNDAAWARRAKDARLLTAWRSFEQESGDRSAWVQVTPLVTDDDAVEALNAASTRFLRNLNARVKVVEDIDIPAVDVRGSSFGWAHEQRTTGTRGDGIALYSAFVIGSTLATLVASGPEASWSWTDISELAQAQADRLS